MRSPSRSCALSVQVPLLGNHHLNTPQDRVRLQCVLRCLEGEFYSYAKQTASGLLFNTRMRRHGETEREYAVALQKLVLYAYKDLPQTHIS